MREGWVQEADDQGGITWLRITTPDGHTHKGGYGSFSLPADSAVSCTAVAPIMSPTEPFFA